MALLVNALAGFLTERFAAASETSAASAVQGGIVCISATHCNSSATLAGAIAASATLGGNGIAFTCASATLSASSATSPCA